MSTKCCAQTTCSNQDWHIFTTISSTAKTPKSETTHKPETLLYSENSCLTLFGLESAKKWVFGQKNIIFGQKSRFFRNLSFQFAAKQVLISSYNKTQLNQPYYTQKTRKQKKIIFFCLKNQVLTSSYNNTQLIYLIILKKRENEIFLFFFV